MSSPPSPTNDIPPSDAPSMINPVAIGCDPLTPFESDSFYSQLPSISEEILVANIHWSELIMENFQDKKVRIEDACRIIENKLVALHQNGRRFGIVVAPEYYWGRGLEKAAYEDVYGWLSELSVKYPRILIIPGTMSWRETIKAEMIPDLLEQLGEMRDDAQYASEPPFVYEVEVAKAIENGKIIRNSAFIAYHSISNSCETLVYNKKTNFHEACHGELYLPGRKHGSVLWCPNLRGQQPCLDVGLEICFDHATMQFRAGIERAREANGFKLHPEIQSQGHKRHIHIVLSNFVRLANEIDLHFLLDQDNLIHSTTVLRYQDILMPRKLTNEPNTQVSGDTEIISEAAIDVFSLNV